METTGWGHFRILVKTEDLDCPESFEVRFQSCPRVGQADAGGLHSKVRQLAIREASCHTSFDEAAVVDVEFYHLGVRGTVTIEWDGATRHQGLDGNGNMTDRMDALVGSAGR